MVEEIYHNYSNPVPSKPPGMAAVGGRLGKPKRSTEEITLKGTFKWMKHIRPDFQFDPAGKWSTVIYLEGEELEKFRELQAQGIKNTLKKDEDGWYTTLSRKCTYQARGKTIGREAPEVFKLVDGKKVNIETGIGNGSQGVAKCILWSSPNFPGKNLRWEAARIDNLIEYDDIPRDYPELKELAEVPPEQLW